MLVSVCAVRCSSLSARQHRVWVTGMLNTIVDESQTLLVRKNRVLDIELYYPLRPRRDPAARSLT